MIPVEVYAQTIRGFLAPGIATSMTRASPRS